MDEKIEFFDDMDIAQSGRVFVQFLKVRRIEDISTKNG